MRGFPQRYVIFDTETNLVDDEQDWSETSLKFRLGVAKVYDPCNPDAPSPRYWDFTDPDRFHAHIAAMPNRKEPIWIFAHNAGFDLRIIHFFRHLSEGGYSLWKPGKGPGTKDFRMPMVVMENPPLIIQTYRPDGQPIVWLDTFQWINMSLASIGKNMGMDKGKMPPEDATIKDWFDYCRLDVDVLDNAMRNIWGWLTDNQIRDFQPTRAGQARYIYRTKYEQKRIQYVDDESLTSLDRKAYYGGRTDLWHVGTKTGPIHQIDVNSLYPHVMHEKWYPCEVIDYDHSPSITDKLPPGNTSSYTAEVYLDSPDIGYPVRCRDGTWFCRGKVRTILSGPELREAVHRGHVSHFGRYTRYRMLKLFKEFVDDYWAMRCAAKVSGDKVSDLVVKLLMNSLYGKFGQMTPEWSFLDNAGAPDDYFEALYPGEDPKSSRRVRCIAGNNFIEVDEHESKHSFIPIAAYVTSYARVLMDAMRQEAGEGHYYYQATDSLYVDDVGLSNLRNIKALDDKLLGKFKHEATYKEVTFRNIHNLNKDDKRVRGSVKPSAKEIAPDTYRTVNWENFSTAVVRGNISEVRLRKLIKQLNPRYLRQEVLADGSCRPWKIDNWTLTPEKQAELRVPKVSD